MRMIREIDEEGSWINDDDECSADFVYKPRSRRARESVCARGLQRTRDLRVSKGLRSYCTAKTWRGWGC